MYLLILVILACSLVPSYCDSGEEKYIDLLPEEEKRAFLEKVARRLVNGVRTKDSRYKSSEELSNEQLNEHSELVKRVLDEETDNLRRDAENKKSEDSDTLKVAGIDKKIVSDAEDYNHIDLTLRQGQRIKRNNNESNSKDGIDHETVTKTYTENDKAKPTSIDQSDVKNIAEESVTNVPLSGEHSAIEDIQVRGRKSRKVHEKPNDQRNVVSREYTKISNYEPEEVTSSSERDSDDDQTVTENDEAVTVPPDTSNEHEDLVKSDNSNELTITEPELLDVPVTTTEISTTTTQQTTTTTTETTKPSTTTKSMKTTTSKPTVGTTIKSSTVSTTKKLKKKYLRSLDDQVEQNNNGTTEKENVEAVTASVVRIRHVDFDNPPQKITDKESVIVTDPSNLVTSESPIINLEIKNKELPLVTHNNFKVVGEIKGIDERDKRENSNERKKEVSKYSENIGTPENDVNNSQDHKSAEQNKSVHANNTNSAEEKIASHEVTTNTSHENVNDRASADVDKTNPLPTTDTPINNSDISESNEYISNKNANESVDNTTHSPLQSQINTLKHKNITSKINFDHKNDVSNKSNITNVKSEKDDINKVENAEKITVSKEDNTVNIKSKISTESDNEISTTPVENMHEPFGSIIDDSINKTALRSDQNIEHLLTTTEKSYTTESNDVSAYTVTDIQNIYSSLETNKANVENTYKQNNEVPKTLENEGSSKLTRENSSLNETDYISHSVGLQNILRALKEGLGEDNAADSKINKESVSTPRKKMKEYLVYEIPEGQTPFVEKNKNIPPQKKMKEVDYNQEQPYYVPVYNYSPNHAYYNAYNRLGPNEEDDEEDENEKVYFDRKSYDTSNVISSSEEDMVIKETDHKKEGLRKFKFIPDENKRPYPRVSKTYFNIPLPYAIKQPAITDIQFEPDDYLDMEFARTNMEPKLRARLKNKNKKCEGGNCDSPSKILSSAEILQPIDLMESNQAKNHISAVRQYMYTHQRFGYVPDIGERTEGPYSFHFVKDHTVSSHTDKDHSANDHKGHHQSGKHNNGDDDHNPAFRANNNTNVFILLPASNLRNTLDRYPKADDISIDYYFGMDDTKDDKKAEFIRSGDKLSLNETVDISELLAEVQRRYRKWKSKKQLEKEEFEKWKNQTGSIKDVLEMSNPVDMFKHLESMSKLPMDYFPKSRKTDEDITVFANVLKDMIEMDDKALVQFDWLRSTVDILAALRNLQYITNLQITDEETDPSDKKLLDYIMELYTNAKATLDDSEEDLLRKKEKAKKSLLPRGKNRKKKQFISLYDPYWLVRERQNEAKKKRQEDLLDFQTFLADLEGSMFNLHNALKHIALITKYKKQNWYGNLKELYLRNPKRKYLLEVVLHLFTTRLISILEDNVKDYFLDNDGNTNYKQVGRAINELNLILRALKEYRCDNLENVSNK